MSPLQICLALVYWIHHRQIRLAKNLRAGRLLSGGACLNMPLACFITLYEACGVGWHTRSRQIEGLCDEIFSAAKPSQYVLHVPLHELILIFLFDTPDKSAFPAFGGISYIHICQDSSLF